VLAAIDPAAFPPFLVVSCTMLFDDTKSLKGMVHINLFGSR
jgi:hypothetical protein